MSSSGSISKKLESTSTKTKILAVYYFLAENYAFLGINNCYFLAFYILFYAYCNILACKN